MSKRVRSRGFCLTINNYEEIPDCIEILESFYYEDENCTYLIYGKEKGKKGTPHLQCYIYYTNQVDLKQAIKWFSPWHVEAQKASKNVNAYYYCMEDNEYTELGTRPRQGHRTDLAVICKDIERGKSIPQISKEYPNQWMQYSRQMDRYQRMHKKKKTKIICYDRDDPSAMLEKMHQYPGENKHVGDLYCMSELIGYKYDGIYDHVFISNFGAETAQEKGLIDEIIF